MFIILPCSQHALILVLEHMGNFGVILPPGCSHHGVSVHCMCGDVGLHVLGCQCTLYVCSNLKLLCNKVTSVSNMYAANPG